MVAEEPVPPNLLAQLLEVPVTSVEEACDALRRGVRRRGSWLRARAGCRRLPLPEPPRPRALRRAVRARRAVVAAVERGARDARDHRLQAADLPRPGRRRSAASTSRRSCAPCSSAATSNRSGAIPVPGQAVLWGTTPLFLEKLGLDSLDDLPPLGDFVPGADVVEALETTLRPAGPDEPADLCLTPNGRPTAEGARATRPRQPASLRGADRRRPGDRQRRGRDPRAPRRRRSSISSRSTAPRSPCGRGSSTTCSTSRAAW